MPGVLTQYDGRRNEPVTDLTVRTFAVRAESLDEATRSVEAIIATEAPVVVMDYRRWEPIDEVLRMDGLEMPAQVPVLNSHNRYSLEAVYGSARELRVEGNQLLGRLFFAEGDPQIDKAYAKVQQRHLRDVSAGYRVLEYVEVEPGKTAHIRGVNYTANRLRLRIATRWQLKEVSLVPIGADSQSKIRSGTHLTGKDHPLNKQLRAFLESIGLRAEATDQQAQEFYQQLGAEDRQRADAAAAAPPPQTPPAPTSGSGNAPPLADHQRQSILQAERDRVRSINELAGADVPAELRTRAIHEGWEVGRASQEFLVAIRSSRGTGGEPVTGPAVHTRSHEADANVRALAAGVLINMGLDPTKLRSHDGRRSQTTRFSEQDAERGHELSQLSAVDLCRECVLIDSGKNVRNYEEAVRTAISGATLSQVFSTSVYARLVEGWEKVGDTTAGWCDEEDVPNFLEQDDISLTVNARPRKLPRGDTAQHATASDSSESYKIARFASQFVMDEQDFLDDRLGALLRMPVEMGEQCRELRPNLVYALMLKNPALADGTAVFHAGSHKNLGNKALGAEALKEAITAMGKHREHDRVLNITPRVLIVPSSLAWTADELTSTAILAKLFASTGDPSYSPENLIARRNLRVVVDDRLGASGVVDPDTDKVLAGSDTHWFLSAGGSKSIRVAYRRGTGRQPQLRSFVLDRGQWGLGWDINFDIGAAFMDYRPWYKSSGNS